MGRYEYKLNMTAVIQRRFSGYVQKPWVKTDLARHADVADFSNGGFAIATPAAYLREMPSKPIELPPRVAKAFVRDMRAFFKEENQVRRDEIAARQCFALSAYQRPRDKKLRLADVKKMFEQMKDHA